MHYNLLHVVLTFRGKGKLGRFFLARVFGFSLIAVLFCCLFLLLSVCVRASCTATGDNVNNLLSFFVSLCPHGFFYSPPLPAASSWPDEKSALGHGLSLRHVPG